LGLILEIVGSVFRKEMKSNAFDSLSHSPEFELPPLFEFFKNDDEDDVSEGGGLTLPATPLESPCDSDVRVFSLPG